MSGAYNFGDVRLAGGTPPIGMPAASTPLPSGPVGPVNPAAPVESTTTGVPGEPPRITPLFTTHDSTPRRMAEGVVQVADHAKAVQVCGATSGPEITLELEVPDGA